MSILSRLAQWLRRDRPTPLPSRPSPPVPERSAEVSPIAGKIEDWIDSDGVGTLALSDGAEVRFSLPACQGFQPLIGLSIEVLATGTLREPEEGLWATRLRLRPGTETEYAARLRIHQVERAVAGKDPSALGTVRGGEPPWARDKSRKLPAGPDRALDAFFVLTVTLARPLPEDAAALAGLLRSPSFPRPAVRLIPLLRKGQRLPGFSAEVRGEVGGKARRAFLLHQPLPYPGHEPLGPAHVGLFVGGPHTPRIAALLPGSADGPPPPCGPDGEVRLLSDLCRALLSRDTGATAVLLNRANKAVKPAEIAQNQLGPEDRPAVPFLFWIDWDLAQWEGRACYQSAGMESLGLPDVVVQVPEGRQEDRARDVLWYACRLLSQGRLGPEADGLYVPRRISLLPGSELQAEDEADTERYQIVERGPVLLVLRRQDA